MSYQIKGKYISRETYDSEQHTHNSCLENVQSATLSLPENEMTAPDSLSPSTDLATILATLGDIKSRISALESAQGSGTNTTHTPPATQGPSGTAATTVNTLFRGPLTSNPAAGELVESMFPTVAPEVVQQIHEHTFKPQDLYKLDPLAHDNECTKLKVVDNMLVSTTDRSTKEYPTFQSISRPLSIYFSILLLYALQSRNAQFPLLMRNVFRYESQLVTLYSESQWSMVLIFHHKYMLERLSEMRSGDYTGWKDRGSDLRADYLEGRCLPKEDKKPKDQKAASSSASASISQAARLAANATQIYMKFNAGSCVATCPQGHRYVCSTCLATAHNARSCTKTT
ncbi:hypothetical protein FRC08_003744 [Ceratobasidium sp. 394]|nr:hypothetical protein FRC08_003744 [Ceratobasidium sp. 394]